ncbi:Dicer-like protein 1 [Fusarium keratoplasticum]|uniref:Dicer-like protein 1 n=1 Tax=Fusarium keratoplasticum TaxID=1328300 RepID=A0ACC0QMJ8_9HYPO|nr:Dicer-like protein 1 [Fusarium keratoplasticum]KAI8660242.1 Dicer-like protein 1 [Fusarium keratoplasticum]
MVVDMGAGALHIRPLPPVATPSGVSHHADLLKEHHASHTETQELPDATGEEPAPSQEEGAGPEYVDTDDEDDIYRLVINPEKPRKISEKKRQDSAALKEWVSQNQREVTRSSAAALNDPNYQSVAHLIKTSESRKIIATPREYQIELFERAKQKNTIVVLPTGTGKTLIAALLLRHYLEQEVEDRAIGKPKKVAFFLVEKVALCYQQYAVLNCNLGEHPITKFWGNMKGMVKKKQYWDQQFSENMVVVCTAQILVDCLLDGFIKMSQINLLIFDEAHHAKKDHAYARIMRNHYIRYQGERPRILGMTASPVDSQTKDVKAAALELETFLCSEIATVSNEVLMEAMCQQKQVEERVNYESLEFPEDAKTQLWDLIWAQVLRNSQFKVSLEFTKEAASTLGSWCADRYWILLLTDNETKRLVARTDRDFSRDFATNQADHATEAVRRVRDIVKKRELPPIEPSSPELSPKMKKLHEILLHAFTRDGTKRCIVFVEKRHTAWLLSDLYQQQGMRIPGMVAYYMIGSQSASSTHSNMSHRDQVVTLQKFKRGSINCLFATTVAEEGIDVPDCDLVIRFDLYNSVIQYLQSKGRARQSNSRYITMLEEGNMGQLRSLKQAERDSTALQKFCLSLPADRKLEDDVVDAVQDELLVQKVYEIPSTGARLTFAHSMEVLSKYAASITPGISSKVEFTVTKLGPKFIADVILPDASPLKAMSGFPQRSKLLAKYSASFEACVKLIKDKHIDGHLQPTLSKTIPRMRNARLAVSSNKKAEYPMRLRPDVWKSLGDCKELFATVITLDNPGALGEDLLSRPLMLLSRKKLPELPGVPLFFGNGRSSVAKLTVSEEPLKLAAEEIDSLTRFTLKVFSDVFSKEYDANADQLPYFLAPCKDGHSSVSQAVDWSIVEATKNDSLPWENAPKEFFVNKFVTDPYDGGRKLVIKGIDESKRPSDPTPKGVPESRSRSYRQVEPTIKEYSNSLYYNTRLKVKWREDQPVVKAQLLSLRRNYLDEFQVDEEVNNDCFVILEPLRVSPIPLDVAFMVMAFPAIIHRIDSALITLDACAMLDLPIPPVLALEAMTKDSDNSGEHDEEQVNFQPGMGNNYERLEFLGDSFLKMATTISLFTLIPESDECGYHVERMILICNQNLFNNAVDRKLHEYIRSKAFDRRTWYPDLPLKKGKAPKTEMRHNLADKSIADVCEALIGAAYLSGKGGSMDLAVKAVTRMVKSKNHKMEKFEDYFAAFKIPAWQQADANVNQRRLVDCVADAVGYRFKWPALLRSAFKHPSWPYDSVPNYQRLEFLGDALLDMAIVDNLFQRFPQADPQWLTEHKMAMASNQFLGCLCVKLDLHKHLTSTTSSLIGQISSYASELELAEEDARQEAKANKTAMRKDFWLRASAPPKAFADVMEALVGAMFVDANYDYTVVRNFFTRFIEPYFEDMALYDSFANKHPVTYLSKKMQQDLGCTNWRVSAENVPCGVEEGIAALTESDVVAVFMVHQKVIANATAKSGRYAKIAVAKRALAMLDEHEGDFETMKRALGCDCKPGAVQDDVNDHGTAI